MDAEVCNVKTPAISKHSWEQKNQMSNKGENKQIKPLQLSVRYSASWLFVCWSATMCCSSWPVWICREEPNGLFKALPRGTPEFPPFPKKPHSRLKTIYPCCCRHHCCNSHASFSVSVSQVIVLLGCKHFELGEICSPFAQSTIGVELDVVFWLCFHVFRGLSVFRFWCMCNWDKSPTPPPPPFFFSAKWCGAITSSLPVGT